MPALGFFAMNSIRCNAARGAVINRLPEDAFQ
jgi:hypothetical protein